MTTDFLIGAIRASRDLHPQVKTELEEILHGTAEAPVIYPETRYAGELIACRGCRHELENGRPRFCSFCGKPVNWEWGV